MNVQLPTTVKTIQFPPTKDKSKLINLINTINAYMDGDLDPTEITIIQVTTERPDIAIILEKVASKDKKPYPARKKPEASS